MTREETKAILMAIQLSFPTWKVDDLTMAINWWHKQLSSYDFSLIEAALESYIHKPSSHFAPSIGDLLGEVRFNETDISALEAWSLVRAAFQDSIYHARESFESLPEVAQKAVGSSETLRQWAASETRDLPTYEAHFIKAYNAELIRAHEELLIPEHVKKALTMSSQRLIGGAHDDLSV